MSKVPPYLKKGDNIGIVAPAGFMPLDHMQTCIATLEEWGYNVHLAPTTQSNSRNYFSGTDAERLRDLQLMLDDPNIHAILCARGGYGVSRIIDRVSFSKFKKAPKWIIGFSDITVLHSHIYANYGIASLHSPMAAAFNDEGADNPYIQSLRNALEGVPARYTSVKNPLDRLGEGRGELVGGNLTLMAHLLGSASEVRTKNRILFLEEIGEYLYNIDRMLVQLKRAGKLDKLAGLVIGGFTGVKDTERPFGKSVYDLVSSHVRAFGYPVCYGFPVSHERENYVLKVGGAYLLKVDGEGTTLSEIMK